MADERLATPQPTPVMSIDTLALSLPAGFERRAARIGRLTAEALAASPPAAQDKRIAVLQLPPLRLRPHWNDRRIAAELALAIGRRIDGGP
jgi:hypothetical protein